MKQTLLTLASVLFCAITFAQSVPQGINYQAVARNVSGAEITNTTLTVQFSVIEQGDSSISWQEAHTVTTNDFGVFTAIIGQGTSTSIGSSATFDDIDWGSTTYSLKLEIDFGGGVFIDMGTTQFMSVPYSFYTHTAANVSATDELQSLYISGDSLCILNGNCIALMSQYLYGCTDSLFCNYQLLANTNDNSCSGIVGCIDHLAFNYNPLATCDDGSCVAVVNGCTDSLAFNYDVLANVDDGSCVAVVNGCTDSLACNYDALVNIEVGSCTYAVSNGDCSGTCFDGYILVNGSCAAVVNGCTDSLACNYDALGNIDDGSCALPNGCGDSLYLEYNDSVTCTDSSACTTLTINGCMNELALNYNSLANLDNGSCTYPMTYVPDDNFEQVLINLGYDNILDDSVLTASIAVVTSLNITTYYNDIQDFTGLEYFIALESLTLSATWGGQSGSLTSLDVSQNTALTYLEFEDHQLTYLNINGATALTHLNCGNNQLTSLDVSNNTALTYLNCYSNQLTSLDLRNGNNTNLSTFWANENPSLTCINVDDSDFAYQNFNDQSVDDTAIYSEDCSNIIAGCMDSTANNYDALANNNDEGSCLYPCIGAPWSENFYSNQLAELAGSWTNNGWLIHAGPTPTDNTGPSDDVTGGENYIYYETSTSSYPSPPQSPVTLTLECLNISGLTNPFLIFNYHMYGGSTGALDVLVNGTNVWSLSGDQGNQWNDAQVSLSDFIGTDIAIEFVATYFEMDQGDVAIDNISVDDLISGPGCTDPLATNYDATATSDDGSCASACTDVLHSTGSYPGEESFTITDCYGVVLAEMTSGYNGFNQCIVLPAIYTISLVDSYGDSWNGANLNIGGVDYTVTSSDNNGDWLTVQVGACP